MPGKQRSGCVAEPPNTRVIRFGNASNLPPGSLAQQVLGQSLFTSYGPSNAAGGMSEPQGVAADDMGRLWVADSGNHRVIWFDDAGTKANGGDADGVLGQRDLFADSTGTSRNSMNSPGHVAIGTSGRVWVCDSGNHRVLRFNPGDYQVDGRFGTRWFGQKGNNLYNLGAGQKVTGTRKNGDFQINYFDLTGGRANITAQVQIGTNHGITESSTSSSSASWFMRAGSMPGHSPVLKVGVTWTFDSGISASASKPSRGGSFTTPRHSSRSCCRTRSIPSARSSPMIQVLLMRRIHSSTAIDFHGHQVLTIGAVNSSTTCQKGIHPRPKRQRDEHGEPAVAIALSNGFDPQATPDAGPGPSAQSPFANRIHR